MIWFFVAVLGGIILFGLCFIVLAFTFGLGEAMSRGVNNEPTLTLREILTFSYMEDTNEQ